MSITWQRWAWRAFKWLLAVAILLAVGTRFHGDLQSLDVSDVELHPAWLAASGLLYLFGLSLSAWYWCHLMHVFGQRPGLLRAVQAYFVGHLGKYVPGKAWALVLRADLVSGPEVRFGVSVIASFYEVLTTMAAGALVAALIFAIDPPQVPELDLPPLATGLLLLALCGIPLLPGVFNFMVGRMGERFQKVDSFRLPRLRLRTLLVGLGVTAIGWGMLGLSVWTILQAIMPEPPTLSFATWTRCCGGIGLAYVAGFLAIFLPGGIGAREYFLLRLLAFSGPEPIVAVAVLLLRLVWTASEAGLAAALLTPRLISRLSRQRGASPQPECPR